MGGRSRRAATTFGSLVLVAALAAVAGGTEPDGADTVTVEAAAPAASTVPDLAALGWQQVFGDEFDGSALDESVWNVVQGDYLGVRSRSSVSVSGGHLRLTTYTDADGRARVGYVQTGNLGAESPSDAGFEAAYGYIEARMKLPDGPATRSAFWAMSANGNNSLPHGDPAADGPEIDIVEHNNRHTDTDESDGDDDGDLDDDGVCDWPSQLGVPCSEFVLSGGHWDGFEEEHKVLHTVGLKRPTPTTTPGSSLQGNFHTYGLLWTPDGYRYYIDGEETYRASGGITYTPEWLILSTSASDESKDFGPRGSASNDVTEVDYVRVWQRPISEIPDQHTVAGRPVAVPFTVTDYFTAGPATGEPGPVRVTATSDDQTLLPNSDIVVTGNGPADPDGSFTNGNFDPGSPGWTFPDLNGAAAGSGNNAIVTAAGTLRLSEVNDDPAQVGRAEQTVTGLLPNTTYEVGMRFDLQLGYTDANGNGRVDTAESLVEPGESETDGAAAFDWGVADVDASRSGNQEARAHLVRNASNEASQPAWWAPRSWPGERVRFTTGPGTTRVTLFVSNQSTAGTPDDADVSVDAMWLRPLVPANRTVTVRPAVDLTGSATVTLTARNVAGQVLGTEDFAVVFQRGSSFTNGDFEALPAGTGWELHDGDVLNGRGADVVIDDPFSLDRALQLSAPAPAAGMVYPAPPATPGTAIQTVTGLTPNIPYTLAVTGKGNLAFAVQDHAGPGSQVAGTIATTDWSTGAVAFTPTGTTARVVLLDWVGSDGSSLVDDLALVPWGTVGPVATSWPALADLGDQTIPSGSPTAVPFTVAATTIRATSSNPDLLPDANLAVTSNTAGAGRRVLSLTPVAGRTGRATVTVTYTDGSGTHTDDIAIVVSDQRLVDPGFERGGTLWALPDTASIVTSGQRTGTAGLRVAGTSATDPVHQTIGVPESTRWDCNTPLVVGGWARGTVTLTVRQPRTTPETLTTVRWTNTGAWTNQQAAFVTPGCYDHDASSNHTKAFELDIEGTGLVDDLYLISPPAIRTIRDISLDQGQTAFAWDTERTIQVGRIPANGFWDPAVVNVTSSDQGVLPDANLELRRSDSAWPYEWELVARAGGTTGRSDVTVRLTDPATGTVSSRTFTVTVSAGDSFDNGDFERGLDGWTDNWAYFGGSRYDRRVVRRAQLMNPPPTNYDGLLRMSYGVVGYRVTGLTPGTDYRVSFRARGDGSSVAVLDDANIFAGEPLSYRGATAWVGVDSAGGWTDYDLTFTTRASGDGSDSVWIQVIDSVDGAVGAEPCVTARAGESCYDDFGVFALADVG